MLKNISKWFKKYQDNITYGLDYLFNELNEENYYEPKEIRGVFDGSYILYESKGNKLALWEYFNKIRPYLREIWQIIIKLKVNGKYS